MVTYFSHHNDRVWKAIAHSKRRMILDALSEQAMTTGELVELLPSIGRTAVLKHIGILHDVDLIRVRREGRTRWNMFNPTPIEQICNPWVTRHVAGINASMARLKQLAEQK